MSDDNREKDPDYEPEYTTIEMRDFQDNAGEDNNCEVYETQGGSMPSSATQVENVKQERYIVPSRRSGYIKKTGPGRDRRTSLIWTKFTIIDKKNQIASCNICDQRMSIRSTSGNLKKHLERKHGFSIKLGVLPGRRAPQKIITPRPRPKLSELAGISADEAITVKVVGENGEEEHFEVLGEQFLSEEVVERVQEHDYSAIENQSDERGTQSEPIRIGRIRSLNESQQSSRSTREPPTLYAPHQPFAHMDDAAKRKRIMELQMECLENKKYNMQLEALAMEQQLNLPRSIFTQPLRYADVTTRGTQTEVGGSDTRVFYITDRRGGRPMQQLFAFQDLDDL